MRRAMSLPGLCRLLLGLGLACGPLSATAQDSARERVSERGELQSLFRDRTFYGRYADNSRWTEYYAPDGRLGYWDGCPHSGHWWIEGEEACFQYPTLLGGNRFCFDVYRAPPSSGRQLDFLSPGTAPDRLAVASTRAIADGNPENLSLSASGCQTSRYEPSQYQPRDREKTP